MELMVDRYQVRRLIGQGAMGKVYLATDPKLGRDVAVKLLSAPNAGPGVRERFRREARAIAALKHPNIVELYDFSGERADDLFLVMEYVPGRALHELVAERGPIPEPTAVCIVHELVLALEHAHHNNIVHRDIKPENVLLYQGRVVLTDFGVVKQIAAGGALGDQDQRTKTDAIGTPGFMSPEQLVGAPITAQTDIFAVGALLYNLVTGRLPFPTDNIGTMIKAVRKGKYQDVRDFNPLLSGGLSSLVDRCLAPKPRNRYGSAGALREAIIGVLKAHGVTEVREEIRGYEANPATHAIEQRGRALDILLRDLKLAIKDKDEPGLQEIVKRMQVIAPLGRQVRDVTGIRWIGKDQARLLRKRRKVPPYALAAAGLIGGLAGGSVALFALVTGLVPTWVMVFFERLADLVGMGY